MYNLWQRARVVHDVAAIQEVGVANFWRVSLVVTVVEGLAAGVSEAQAAAPASQVR